MLGWGSPLVMHPSGYCLPALPLQEPHDGNCPDSRVWDCSDEGHDLQPCGFDCPRLPVYRPQHIVAALIGCDPAECVQLRL